MNNVYLPLIMNGEEPMADGEYISFGQTFTKVLDVSKFQDKNETAARPDFKKARAKGTRGVVIRVSANFGVDEDAEYNWKAVQDADMIPLAYHWFEYRAGIMKSGGDQAKTCLDTIDMINGTVENVPLFLDYEQPNADWPVLPPYYESIANLSRFYEVTDPNTKRLTGLYGNRNTVYAISPVPTRTLLRPFWPAGWMFNRLMRAEEITGLSWRPNISPWTKFTVWQCGLTYGYEYGMESAEVDLNFFNGTFDQLAEFAGYTIPTEPTQPPEPIDILGELDNIEQAVRSIREKLE